MRAHVRPNVEIIAAIERGKQRALEEKRRSDIEKQITYMQQWSQQTLKLKRLLLQHSKDFSTSVRKE